jgi:hypothetical protein
MTTERIPRAQRLRRIRRAVAGAAAALFIASLGAVLAFGRQPAASHATAASQSSAPAASDPWAQDDQSSQAVVPDASSAPLTSQSS